MNDLIISGTSTVYRVSCIFILSRSSKSAGGKATRTCHFMNEQSVESLNGDDLVQLRHSTARFIDACVNSM